MAQAEFREVLKVEADRFFSTVVQYDDYPEFVEGCTSVNLEPSSDPTRKRVSYVVNVMSQEVKYTLDHQEDRARGKVEWTLVDSNFFKKNVGKWEIKAVGPKQTEIVYSLEVEFKIPVPGFILNRLIKGSLPGMVRSFEKRAQQA